MRHLQLPVEGRSFNRVAVLAVAVEKCGFKPTLERIILAHLPLTKVDPIVGQMR